MRIIIETISHKEHRYETVGDWWWEGDTLEVRVSKLSNPFRSFLVAYHEIFEAMWCRKNGVEQKSVDAFDMKYEKRRKRGDDSEPGDDPKAPYYIGHQIATVIERLACIELDENWNDYDKEVTEL